MNSITFNYNTNVIRTQVAADGEPLFCAADVCAALGYSNTRDAVVRHVDEEDVVKRDTPTNSGNQLMTYINESGLYALIFGSKLETAKEFKHWVTSEVLPSIRKTGKYEAPKSEALSVERKLNAAKIILEPAGIKGNQLTLALDKVYKANTGESLLAQSGVELARPQQVHLATPSEIGIRLAKARNLKKVSGQAVNKMLADKGYQERIDDKWVATEAGIKAGATYLDVGKSRSSGTPITQLKWPLDVLD